MTVHTPLRVDLGNPMSPPNASALSEMNPVEESEGLDITAIMVFGVTSIGLGGFSLISLLGLMGFG